MKTIKPETPAAQEKAEAKGSANAGRSQHPAPSTDGQVPRAQDALERPSGDTSAPGRMPKCGERRDAQEPPSVHVVGERSEGVRMPEAAARAIEQNLRHLEFRIEELIQTCDRLREENALLRSQQASFLAERANLLAERAQLDRKSVV